MRGNLIVPEKQKLIKQEKMYCSTVKATILVSSTLVILVIYHRIPYHCRRMDAQTINIKNSSLFGEQLERKKSLASCNIYEASE